jgi:hypothetical protein
MGVSTPVAPHVTKTVSIFIDPGQRCRCPLIVRLGPFQRLTASILFLNSETRSQLVRLERYGPGASVLDPERRAVLGLALTAIVEARGRDVGVAEPLLHLGDIAVVG